MVAFDPAAKERELHDEANSWDTSAPVPAEPGDIPTVDVGPWVESGDPADLAAAAEVLQDASERVGFHQLVGHGISDAEIDEIFAATRAFHALDEELKQPIRMDRPGHPIGGSGWMPVGERKLPRRAKGNLNEAFLVKRDEHIGFDDNQWLADDVLPGFRATVEAYNRRVDTTFFTLLLQDSPGLTIFSAERQQWISAPAVPGAFVVNSGELLRTWSNDRVLSTRHFANNSATESRYSIPFFFNATGDFPMECLPTCHGPDNPPKYATISYNQSQAVVQGE